MSEVSARRVTPPAAALSTDRITRAQAPQTRLLAYIAHELRTPLATQRALLELALADRDTDTWRNIAGELLDACAQQERLLEACLALGQSEAGAGSRENVDIALLTTALVHTSDLEGLPVRSCLKRAQTVGDPSQIERLLANLLGNAVRHNQPDGWIEITTRNSRGRAIFAIENTGAPIPADELAHLFDPFHQGATAQRPTPNTHQSTGFGLGLAVAKAIADAHAALITANARPAGGLRVEVAFPATSRNPSSTVANRS